MVTSLWKTHVVLRETGPTPSLTQQRGPPAGHVGEGEGDPRASFPEARPQYLAGFSPPGWAMPRLAPRAWNPSLCLGFQASGQAAHWAQSMGCTLVPPPSAPGPLYRLCAGFRGPRVVGRGQRSAGHRTGWDQSLAPTPPSPRSRLRPRSPPRGVWSAVARTKRGHPRETSVHDDFLLDSAVAASAAGGDPASPRGASILAPSAWPELRAHGPPAPATTPGPPSIPARNPTTTCPLPFRSPP